MPILPEEKFSQIMKGEFTFELGPHRIDCKHSVAKELSVFHKNSSQLVTSAVAAVMTVEKSGRSNIRIAVDVWKDREPSQVTISSVTASQKDRFGVASPCSVIDMHGADENLLQREEQSVVIKVSKCDSNPLVFNLRQVPFDQQYSCIGCGNGGHICGVMRGVKYSKIFIIQRVSFI